MIKEPKLKVVKTGYVPVAHKPTLRAKQIIPLMLSSGVETVVMVSEEGKVYTLGADGWLAFNMVEEHNDPTV